MLSMLYFWVVLVCPGDTPGVRLCFRNIFSVGDIVTDAHLTMYSVLFHSLFSVFSHTYYSSLSLLQMHKLHSLILHSSLSMLWITWVGLLRMLILHRTQFCSLPSSASPFTPPLPSLLLLGMHNFLFLLHLFPNL